MNEPDRPSAAELDEQFATICRQLQQVVHESVTPWLERLVRERTGDSMPAGLADVIEAVAVEVDARITRLVEADIDEPLSGPLETIRQSLGPLTAALSDAGVPTPARDPQSVEMRPNDTYDLGPMSFAEVSDELHNAGIAWGAGKAFLHRARRASE